MTRMDLFLLKKIIGFLIMPLSLVAILLILAILYFKRKPAFSFKCLLCASILLIGSSSGFIADNVMYPLENNYDSFTQSNKPLDYIIILGCGHTSDDTLPATSQLKACSLQRLVEALRIFKLHPEAQIITSGAAFNNKESNAEKVKQAAVLLGIPEHKILIESFPKDTEEEAELIAPRVIGKNVVLVTNADHMIRSVNYFEQQDVTVIPAPASNWVKDINSPKNWRYYLPSSKNLLQTTTAWYESVGLFVQWINKS
ncbi:ElyC/SanA/YdcF family protein [Colwelliaceae bacterium 6441]